MAVASQLLTVTTTAQQIVIPDLITDRQAGCQIWIHNHEHSQNSEIYIGNSGVTTSTGIHAVATQTSMITIGPGDDLWAVSDTNAVEIQVLVIKQD